MHKYSKHRLVQLVTMPHKIGLEADNFIYFKLNLIRKKSNKDGRYLYTDLQVGRWVIYLPKY